MSNEINGTINIKRGELANEWPQYNLSSAPVFMIGSDGKEYESEDYKAILRTDRPSDRQLAAFVSTRYTLFPNEEALRIATEASAALGFTLQDRFDTRNGNLMYATFLSEKFTTEVKVGDVVKVGFTVRNSIDASSGFGLDAYTYRLKCTNGLITRAQSAELNASAKHIGDIEKFMARVVSTLNDFTNRLGLITDTYRQWADELMEEKYAQELAKRLPAKYLPKYVKVERGTHKVTMEGRPTIWEFYNDVTDPIWHNADVDIRSKALYGNILHETLTELTIKPKAV